MKENIELSFDDLFELENALFFYTLQVSKCFVAVQIFCASPKIWLHLVALQNLLCQYKNQFYWMQIIFLSGTKCLWLAQYVCLLKIFGPAQNILGPVKGQSKDLNKSGKTSCSILG